MQAEYRAGHFAEIPPTAGLPLRLRDLLPPWNSDFAERATDYIGAPGGGLECSGTVIVPAYTCPLVVFAIARCGLKVRVCDLAPDSFELDLIALRAACDTDTLAIIPTHLAGRVARLDGVMAIAREAQAFVIEDAAQSFAARQGGLSVGLQGDAGFFSFAAGKGLSLYEGGLWVARDASMRDAIARASAGLIPRRAGFEALRCAQLAGYATLYRPVPLRFVYGAPLRRALRRNDPVEATGDDFAADIPLHRVSAWRRSVGSRALQRLAGFQRELAAQAGSRLPQLTALGGLKVFDDMPDAQGVWPSFLLLMPSPAMRDAAMTRLWGAGLGVTRMFAYALPDYSYLRTLVPPAEVPNARSFAARSLTISNSLWLDDTRFQRVVAVLADVLRS